MIDDTSAIEVPSPERKLPAAAYYAFCCEFGRLLDKILLKNRLEDLAFHETGNLLGVCVVAVSSQNHIGGAVSADHPK